MTQSQELLERKKKAEDELLKVRSEAIALLPTKIEELSLSYKEYCEQQNIEYDFDKRAINLLTPLVHINKHEDPWRIDDVRIISLWTDFLEAEVDDPDDRDPISINIVSTINIILIISDLEIMIANPDKVKLYGDK